MKSQKYSDQTKVRASRYEISPNKRYIQKDCMKEYFDRCYKENLFHNIHTKRLMQEDKNIINLISCHKLSLQNFRFYMV